MSRLVLIFSLSHIPTFSRGHLLSLVGLGVCLLSFPSPALTLSLIPVADTHLSQTYPSNNFGGLPFFNSGTTQNSNYNRGLFRFDLTSAIPPGSKITHADLIMEVVGQPPPDEDPPSARFNLHRALKPWGEGNKISPTNCSSCTSQGSPASTNEATWFFRFAFTTNLWTEPGASPGNDFVPAPSSGVTAGGIDQSPYTIPSTPAMVADLQLWLDQPQTNFGWILVCQQETTKFTARRFGSREDPENAPELIVTFIVPPHIDRVEKLASQFNLYFTALPEQNYAVEYRTALSGAGWQTLATFPAQPATNSVIVADTVASPQKFYRLVSY